MLRSFGEGIWYDMGPVSMLGMQLTATMTVLRLGDGGLLVHSPLPLTEERREDRRDLSKEFRAALDAL